MARKRQRILDRVYRADRRDKAFAIQAEVPGRQYRVWKPLRILDQGYTSGCVGYGIAGWLGCKPIVNRIKPDGIYKYARFIDEWEGEEDEGTSVRAGIKTISSESDFGFGLVGRYEWGWDLSTLIATLANDGPVVMGLPWMTGMLEPDSNGFVHANGVIEGGHCIYANGVSIQQRWISMPNSWGTGWGRNGVCRITFDDMQELLDIDGEFVRAEELKA